MDQLEQEGYRFSHYVYDGQFRELWIHPSGREVLRVPDEKDTPVMVRFRVVGAGPVDDVRPVAPGRWITGPVRPPEIARNGPNWTSNRSLGNWPEGFTN